MDLIRMEQQDKPSSVVVPIDFNLDAIKAEMGKRMAEAEAASKGPSD